MPVTNYRGYTIPNATGDPPAGAAQIRALAAGIDQDVAQLDRGMRLYDRMMITSSQTFLKASIPGLKAVFWEFLAGGGGSGAVLATSGSQVAISSGGGGGMYGCRFMLESEIGASVALTVGGGGNGGVAAGSSVGVQGGMTEWNDGTIHLQVEGGPGGANLRSGALGSGYLTIGGGTYADDTFGSFDMVVPGAPSSQGALVLASSIFLSAGGAGAVYGTPSLIGSTGAGVTGTDPVDAAVGSYGSGGGGGFNLVSQSGRNGGAGTDGLIVAWIYV